MRNPWIFCDGNGSFSGRADTGTWTRPPLPRQHGQRPQVTLKTPYNRRSHSGKLLSASTRSPRSTRTTVKTRWLDRDADSSGFRPSVANTKTDPLTASPTLRGFYTRPGKRCRAIQATRFATTGSTKPRPHGTSASARLRSSSPSDRECPFPRHETYIMSSNSPRKGKRRTT